ncbi:MAG: helix-turn-helix domain-containing protein [Candidatus Omnitrophota bacterium]
MESKRDDVIQAQVVARKVSISELAKQVENREVDPKSLGKKELRYLVLYFKTRGYPSDEIAEILRCNIRTVQRYIQNAREENLLNINTDFQTNVAEGFYSNFKSQSQRLLRLSYSEKLSDAERAKIICVLHQMWISAITTLRQLGYLSQDRGTEDTETTRIHKLLFDAIGMQDQLLRLISEMRSVKLLEGLPEDYKKKILAIFDEEQNFYERLSNSIGEYERWLYNKHFLYKQDSQSDGVNSVDVLRRIFPNN